VRAVRGASSVMALFRSAPPLLTQRPRSRTETTSEAGDAGPPPGPLCPPSSAPPQHATTAGPLAATPWPSADPYRGRHAARGHGRRDPCRLSPTDRHLSVQSWVPPLEISPSDGSSTTPRNLDTDMAPRARRSLERAR